MSTATQTATPSARPDAARRGTGRPPVVAMIGAGQLARMSHRAAIDLGIELRVLATGDHDPAVTAGARHVIGSPENLADLRALAAGADVVTFDHERIPPAHLAALEEEGTPLAPSARAKLLAQDKLHARRELAALGFPVPPFAHVRRAADAAAFAATHGWPLVGKSPSGGYDGRGVFPLDGTTATESELRRHADGLLVEPRLDIVRELAVLVARSESGALVTYPVAETVQVDAMCREIVVPARIDPPRATAARELASMIVSESGAVGVVAVELFETSAGLLVNELALRPHNSGHYTIEGCTTSQFAQHLRAVLGWPLGLPQLVAPAVATVNVVGPPDGSDPAAALGRALRVAGAHVHLYGKAPRAGRKLGHVTACACDAAGALAIARRAAAILEGREA